MSTSFKQRGKRVSVLPEQYEPLRQHLAAFGILHTSNKQQVENDINIWYGDSYLAVNPKNLRSPTVQQLGLVSPTPKPSWR